MIAIDFFCGAGGFTRGLIDAGICVRLGVDVDPILRRTYEENNPVARFVDADIRRLDSKAIAPYLDCSDPADQLLVACAPCQPFTKLNGHAVERGNATLLGHFGRIALDLQPGFIVVENVPGMARVGGRSTFMRLLKALERSGYEYCVGTVDAKDYGVPQTRRRLLLVASRVSSVILPAPTHGPGRLPYPTVRDAIGHFPALRSGQVNPSVPNHRAAGLSQLNLERLQHTPHDGGRRKDWPERLWLECHRKGNIDYTDVYGRMSWDLPAPTITCRCDSISNGRFGHPEQDRAVSLREAASLQSFPDSYVFYGPSKRSLAAQIGNAVPVKLAEAIGQHVRQMRARGR